MPPSTNDMMNEQAAAPVPDGSHTRESKGQDKTEAEGAEPVPSRAEPDPRPRIGPSEPSPSPSVSRQSAASSAAASPASASAGPPNPLAAPRPPPQPRPQPPPALPRSSWRWMDAHLDDAEELTALLLEAAPRLGLRQALIRPPLPARVSRTASLEVTASVRLRVDCCEPLRVDEGSLDWSRLRAAVCSELLEAPGGAQASAAPGELVEVNSGGRVFFCILERPALETLSVAEVLAEGLRTGEAAQAAAAAVEEALAAQAAAERGGITPLIAGLSPESSPIPRPSSTPALPGPEELEGADRDGPARACSTPSPGPSPRPPPLLFPGREGCVVLKFLPSRLQCQSEQFAAELAGVVGVPAPQSRILRQHLPPAPRSGEEVSSPRVQETAEWQALAEAAERLSGTWPDLAAELSRSSCALVLEFVPGVPLAQAPEAFATSESARAVSFDLGRLLALDMLLGNPDRLPCRELGWRGNASNLLWARRGRWRGRCVAIDAQVQRRPPGNLTSAEDAACERLAELALNDLGVAGDLLREAVAGLVGRVGGGLDRGIAEAEEEDEADGGDEASSDPAPLGSRATAHAASSPRPNGPASSSTTSSPQAPASRRLSTNRFSRMPAAAPPPDSPGVEASSLEGGSSFSGTAASSPRASLSPSERRAQAHGRPVPGDSLPRPAEEERCVEAAFQQGLRAGLGACLPMKGLLEMMADRANEWIAGFLRDVETAVEDSSAAAPPGSSRDPDGGAMSPRARARRQALGSSGEDTGADEELEAHAHAEPLALAAGGASPVPLANGGASPVPLANGGASPVPLANGSPSLGSSAGLDRRLSNGHAVREDGAALGSTAGSFSASSSALSSSALSSFALSSSALSSSAPPTASSPRVLHASPASGPSLDAAPLASPSLSSATTTRIRQLTQGVSRDAALADKVARWTRLLRARCGELAAALAEWQAKRGLGDGAGGGLEAGREGEAEAHKGRLEACKSRASLGAASEPGGSAPFSTLSGATVYASASSAEEASSSRVEDAASFCSALAESWQDSWADPSPPLPPRLTTGFLDGARPIVDVYELAVRLEHSLARLRVLAPCMATARPSLVVDGLYLSGAVGAASLHVLRHLGVSHVLNATADLPCDDGLRRVAGVQGWLRASLRDVEEEDLAPAIAEALTFIDAAHAEGGIVLVHCHAGRSRSASLVLAWLMTRRRWTLARARRWVERVHHAVAPNAGYMLELLRLEEKLLGRRTVKVRKTKPAMRRCPECRESVGISAESVLVHLRTKHPAKHTMLMGELSDLSSAGSTASTVAEALRLAAADRGGEADDPLV